MATSKPLTPTSIYLPYLHGYRERWVQAAQRVRNKRTKTGIWERDEAEQAYKHQVTLIKMTLPKRRVLEAPPPWPESRAITPWQVWVWQAQVDIRTGVMPPDVREAYRERLAVARHLVRGMLRLEALGLPGDLDYPRSRWPALQFRKLKGLRRWFKETGQPLEEIDAYIAERRISRKARTPGRLGPGEAIDVARAKRKERERRRVPLPAEVWYDEQGVPEMPLAPQPDAPQEHWETYIDQCDAASVVCYYSEAEQACIRYPLLRAAREEAYATLERIRQPPVVAPQAPPEPPPLTDAEQWARDFTGPHFEREGLKWIHQSNIKWFRQRECKIRSVAWKRHFGARYNPTRKAGTFWGFKVARGGATD